MMKRLANLKFHYKLLIGMIFITSAALFMISQLSYSYFYKRNTNEVLKKAGSSVQMAGDSLSSQFNSLSAATNHLLVKEPFPKMISDINNRNFTGYAKYFSAATSLTDSFLQNHDIVNNVLICGEDHIVFSPASLGIGNHFEQLFPESIWQYTHITVLPTRFSNMFGKEGAIPIAYPISSDLSSGHLSYHDIPDSRKARFILLIDTSQIRDYFNRMSNRYTYCMYLADETGHPLDITKSEYPDAFLPQIQQWIEKGPSTQEGLVKLKNEDMFLTMNSIKFCNLKIVHLTKKSALTGDIKELRSFFILVWIACFLAAVLLSLALSGLLTRDLKVLGTIIRSINDKTYTKRRVFNHTDEISLLGVQLNQMYDTIQLQLLQIKDEEQKKATAEIQMMSEQINPHFLYNTLECIHFQILNDHSETAEGMLESLGKYLRTTLSFGKTLISVEKEVEHVTSYMEIMNRHSSNGILMETQIDPLLKDCKIMKILLQPLAENCIRHGFGGSVTSFEPVPPRIDILITSADNNRIKIEVTDNGKGIDVEMANACITENSPESQKHFGLSNIQKRLKACYGDSFHISFLSIPYLKNSVIIELPKDI
ncbi:MAG: integral rane sensor signal transduction histidine kinase [Lacrimispora sp.]|jgi:sensor histidine kinase YesM|nr:integral rane sensor signal transduction histidine kinase [Lacrimispora sp.]